MAWGIQALNFLGTAPPFSWAAGKLAMTIDGGRRLDFSSELWDKAAGT